MTKNEMMAAALKMMAAAMAVEDEPRGPILRSSEEQFKYYRIEVLCMSQTTLSRILGVSHPTLRKAEGGYGQGSGQLALDRMDEHYPGWRSPRARRIQGYTRVI